MKYSIIIPAYNVEKYIDKCLSSILEQTYSKYEVIVVNDGSQDNSLDIINKFVKKSKKIKVFTKENSGLSDARNYGIERASGDVLLFIDGDDYIDKDLLLRLNEEFKLSNDIDVVRFQLRLVNENNITLEQPAYRVFSNLSSNESYSILLRDNYVDVACGYAYRKDFFIRNNFKYAKGRIHEDLGLTHLILIKANKISSIDYVGYNYVQRDGSITNTHSKKQNIKKVYDTLYHFDNYIKILSNDSNIDNINRKLLIDYLLRVIVYKASLLKNGDLENYIKELKKREIYKLFPNETKKDKLRKLVIKYCLKQYIRKNS